MAATPTDLTRRLEDLLRADERRMTILATVASLELPDGWIGAGFVRNAAWDALHGRSPSPVSSDVDVIWFERADSCPERDRELEERLRSFDPAIDWSVKNQARMHDRNGDPPYGSAIDAIRYWPETATAVAARLSTNGAVEVAAPLGLDDLFSLRLRPTPWFAAHKLHLFDDRVAAKGWVVAWPDLKIAPVDAADSNPP